MKESLNLNFTGCQVLHSMTVLIPYMYQFIKPFLDNKISSFEEYGDFNHKSADPDQLASSEAS